MAPSCSKSNDNPKEEEEDTKKGNRGKPKKEDEDENSSSKSKSKTKTVEILSSDSVTFCVDELSAMESCVMTNWIQFDFDDCALEFHFTSEILSKVVEFCKKHAEIKKTNEKDAHEKMLMDFNSQFLKQNQTHLFDLVPAACRLQIRSLLDVTSEAVVGMMTGKTPEEINKMFNMTQDFTLEEATMVFVRDNWCYE